MAIKINLGGGRKVMHGFLNIDKTQWIDGNNTKVVDRIVDIEIEELPFRSDEVDEILADNVFEHLGDGFIHCLNECHRVLKVDGVLWGVVPVAGTNKDFKDPTHKRHFIKETFDYFVGIHPVRGLAMPAHPKYADYGIKPWDMLDITIEDDLIHFKMKPRKLT